MSKFHEGYGQSQSINGDGVAQIGELAKEYPELAAAFRGHSRDDGPGPVIPPMTLMVYFRDRRWRASLSSTDSAQTCYFKVESILDLFPALEKAILTGDYERIAKKGK
jgi:hypothetical protein